MKYFLLIILLSIYAFNSHAETWTCAYIFNDKAEVSILQRQGKNFITENGWVEDILRESDKTIFLYKPAVGEQFCSRVINKSNKRFNMICLMPPLEGKSESLQDRTSYIEGKCELTN